MDRRGALHYVCAILLVGEKSEEFEPEVFGEQKKSKEGIEFRAK